MAAEFVGGALLSATFDVLLERLTPHVDFLSFIRGKKLDQNLLHQLKATLIAARAVLNDAELKQIRDSAVKEWLDELKDAHTRCETKKIKEASDSSAVLILNETSHSCFA